MANDSEEMPIEVQQGALPPPLEIFLQNLKADRKRFLKEEAWSDPKQQRQFIGQFLFPRLEEMFRILSQLGMESYGLAASNTTELRRLHAFTVDNLQDLGADLDSVRPPGVSPEALNAFNESFYALGTVLQEKYPQDKETEAAYNRCQEAVDVMVKELMDSGGFDYDADSDDADSDDDDRDDDDRDDSDDDSSDDDSSDESSDDNDDDGADDSEKTDG